MIDNNVTAESSSYHFSTEVAHLALELLGNTDGAALLHLNEETLISLGSFINHHGITSYLYTKPTFGDNVKPILRKLLKNHYFALTIRNTQLSETYRSVTALFTQHGIEHLPLKGAFLLPVIYQDWAGRSMCDLDILIRPKDYQTARALLFTLGANQENTLESALLQDLGHHYPPFVLFNTSIEIHNRILAANMKYNIPVEDVWDNLVDYSVDGESHKGLTGYLLVCYLALHLHYSEMRGEYRLYWYLDILKVIKSMPEFTAQGLETWLVKYRISKPVFAVLANTAFIFDFPIIGIKPLSKGEQEELIQHLALQKTEINKGYSIALERVLYTKGFGKKLRFIYHTVIDTDSSQKNGSSFYRLIKIGQRLLHYLSNKLIAPFK